VFGLSFGELVVLLLVSVIVLGPKELPRYLRKAGQFAGRMRQLAFEMREKSGIDEVLRTEGLDRDIAEIRRLARGELGGVASAMRSVTGAARLNDVTATVYGGAPSPNAGLEPGRFDGGAASPPALNGAVAVEREREYPREGADAYGALPDTAVVYDGSLPASPLSEDPLYASGERATAPAEAPASNQ
jgi:sec-independent protein translocase protein TatB